MRALLPTVLVLALLSPAAAHHCTTWSTSAPEAEAFGHYVDVDCLPVSCSVDAMPQVWIYAESNGITGLQREDPLVDDTCHGMIDGDTLLF